MNGTDSPKIIYWDACIYLAWLKKEEKEHGKEFIDAIHELVKENFAKKAVIVTSTITYIEVLSSRLESLNRRSRSL